MKNIDPELARAMKRLVNNIGPGKGITKMTISTNLGTEPVVIDGEAAENIRRNADEIIRRKSGKG